MLRDDIKTATITAMKAGEKKRTSTLRLIGAKIKDRDIEIRGQKAAAEGRSVSYDNDHNPIPPRPFAGPKTDDDLVTEVLQKMAKQRRESIQMYDDGGRKELADQERSELAVIEEFLPQMMDEAATRAAIDAVKADVGAVSIKDMGRVMGELKKRHGAELDMGLASGLVKASFG